MRSEPFFWSLARVRYSDLCTRMHRQQQMRIDVQEAIHRVQWIDAAIVSIEELEVSDVGSTPKMLRLETNWVRSAWILLLKDLGRDRMTYLTA